MYSYETAIAMCLFTELSVGGIASLSPQPTAKHMLLGAWLLLASSEEGLGAEGDKRGNQEDMEDAMYLSIWFHYV